MPTPTSQAFAKLEKRVDLVERGHAEHKTEDQGHFASLRGDIAAMGVALGERITDLGANLQSQIDGFARDKIHAEGVAEGLATAKIAEAEANAKLSKPKWWAPMLRSLVLTACGAVVAVMGWMASTIWNLEQDKITALQARPASSVIVNPPPAAQAPIATAPEQAPPP